MYLGALSLALHCLVSIVFLFLFFAGFVGLHINVLEATLTI